MDSKQIEAFFFEAMKRGWVAGAEEMPVPGFPGSYGISFAKGKYSLLDYFFVNKNEKNDFSNFRGYEYIISASPHTGVSAGEKLGEHNYFGGLI